MPGYLIVSRQCKCNSTAKINDVGQEEWVSGGKQAAARKQITQTTQREKQENLAVRIKATNTQPSRGVYGEVSFD